MKAALEALLRPPEKCQAFLWAKQGRRSGPWFCRHAKKFTGKGAKQPECLCRKALSAIKLGEPTS